MPEFVCAHAQCERKPETRLHFHFLSAPTQNSSRAVMVSVDIHGFHLNVSEVFCQNRGEAVLLAAYPL